MNTDETTIRAIAGINLFPERLRQRILDDAEFRIASGIHQGRTVTFDRGVATFESDNLYGAIRRLYGARSPVQVKDEEGARWRLRKVSTAGAEHLTLTKDGVILRLAPEPGLNPDVKRRLDGFERAAANALASSNLDNRWRTLLAERPLTNEENHRLEAELRETPHHVAHVISQGMDRGESKFSELVPESEGYFLELLGGRRSQTLADYVTEDLPGHIDRLTNLDRTAGLKSILRLSAHSSIGKAVPLEAFEGIDVKALTSWLQNSGSMLSQVGVLEALAPHLDVYDVEEELTAIVQGILKDNPKSKNSRFRLLSSLFVFVDGELSRTKVLADWPPTLRRLASLAHASLIEEQSLGRVRLGDFSNRLWDLRVNAFSWQSLSDLRLAPRWRPDFATPEQMKQELLSRILGAASRWRDDGSPAGKLSKLVFGKARGSLASHLHIVAAFRPGPLEGAEDKDLEDLNPELEDIVAEPLTAATPPTPQSFVPLLNISGVFRIRPEHIESAVQSIRSAGHRITGFDNDDSRSSIYSGLAYVAAAQRSEELAAELRVMLRYARNVGAQAVPYPEEFLIATSAAGCSADLETWCKILGEWVTEIAFAIDDPIEAEQIRASLAKLCHAVPELWCTAGPADAALEAIITRKKVGDFA